MLKKSPGFTIVELLIVIVVIGILAAITIIAYNGIQDRAKFTQQAVDIDKVGKAIKLWEAENGKSMGESGYGYNGLGLGNFYTNAGAYPSPSLFGMLQNAGYLPASFNTAGVNSTIMLTPCTTLTDNRWVVLATFNPAPPTSVSDQITASGCNSGYITSYTGAGYNRNYVKAF